MLRRHPHTPAHLFVDDAAYFITGAIYGKRPLLRDNALKQILFEAMEKSFGEYGWSLAHWVILDNHYHLMAQSRRGEDLAAIMHKLHGRTGHIIRAATHCELPVWWNYWDYCPRDEHDYTVHLNYLLYNPIKHGAVSDLKDYPYSSFSKLFQEVGKERLSQQFRDYPEFRTLDGKKDDF
jgi:putative transposase